MIKLIVSHYFSLLGNNENKDYPASNQYLDCTLLNVMNDIFGQKKKILLLVSFIIYFLHVNFLLCQNLLPSNRPITYITLPAKFTIILSWLKILITKSIWLFLQLHSLSQPKSSTFPTNTFTVSLSRSFNLLPGRLCKSNTALDDLPRLPSRARQVRLKSKFLEQKQKKVKKQQQMLPGLVSDLLGMHCLNVLLLWL